MSTRDTPYKIRLKNVNTLFGEFPQLVTTEMVELLRPHADHYVESICATGLPQALYSRVTGQPTTITMRQDLGGSRLSKNHYYPSPEMHLHTFQQLYPLCARLCHEQDLCRRD